MDDLCRACLCTEKEILLKSIFFKNLPIIYKSLTNLKITENDGLSSKICINCMDHLLKFDEFKLKCIKSNDILRIKSTLIDSKHEVKIEKDIGHYQSTNIIKEEDHQNATLAYECFDVLECVVKEENSDVDDDYDEEDDEKSEDDEEDEDAILNDTIDHDKDEPNDKKIKISGKGSLRKVPAAPPSPPPKKIRKKSVTNAKRFKPKNYTIRKNYPYICNKCGAGFQHEERYQGHLREHEGKPAAVCEFCGEEYTWLSSLRGHLEREHKDQLKYKCHCGKIFVYESALIGHKATHQKSGYICEECGKSFNDSYRLRKHLLVHQTETPFACDICGKQFKAEFRLREHKFRHQNIRNHKCETCGKAYITRSELNIHNKSHIETLNFNCQLCAQSFRSQSQLTAHLKTHGVVQPYYVQPGKSGAAFGNIHINNI